jgi:hypothetical protein
MYDRHSIAIVRQIDLDYTEVQVIVPGGGRKSGRMLVPLAVVGLLILFIFLYYEARHEHAVRVTPTDPTVQNPK